MNKIISAIAGLFIFVTAAIADNADNGIEETLFKPTVVTFMPGVVYNPSSRQLQITGRTTHNQYVAVLSAMERFVVNEVIMFGNGGLVEAGLNIGHLIAQEGSSVIIPEGRACVSSCAFSAVAAKEIVLEGEIWFHAPFIPVIPIDRAYNEILQVYVESYIPLTIYLYDYGIQSEFISLFIVSTSPCRYLVIEDSNQLNRIRESSYLSIDDFRLLDKCNN